MDHRRHDPCRYGRCGRRARWPKDYALTVHDAFRNIASVTVNSAGYVDYLHIARFEDRWRIVNVLFEPLER